MILGAGLGTRLRPLTERTPKVLAPVLGVPFLDRLAGFLARGGVQALALNTHHLPEAVAAHVAAAGAAWPPVELFHEPELLGTGGGVVNVARFWGQAPLLVWNGDVAADVAPGALLERRAATGALAVLLVRERPSDSRLLVDGAGWVCGIDSARRGDHRLLREPRGAARALAFCGVSVLHPALAGRLAQPPPFDLVSALLELIAAGGAVAALDAGAAFWGTTGTAAKLAALEAGLAADPALLARWAPPPGAQSRA